MRDIISSFLYKHYTLIYNKALNDELDLNYLLLCTTYTNYSYHLLYRLQYIHLPPGTSIDHLVHTTVATKY